MKKYVVAIAFIGGLLHAVSAYAAPCTDITELPVTLSEPGRYCLTADMVFEGTASTGVRQRAVLVAANDVTVDLNGFSIQGTGTASLSTLSFGVYASGRSNVTVTNGRVRGFGTGVGLYSTRGVQSNGYVVESMTIDGSLIRGIAVFGENLTVRNNQVTNVIKDNTTGTPWGIYTGGNGARVIGNQVSNVTSVVSTAGGIYAAGFGMLIQGNSVSGISSPALPWGPWGVLLASGSSNSTIKDNVIHNTTTAGDGISATVVAPNLMIDNNVITGFNYAINLGTNLGKYKNNTSLGAGSAMPYYGGVDIGGNN